MVVGARGDVDMVAGDERRIRQVIFNLLSNAVKFTPAGGAVDVRTTPVNGEVRVFVIDTGPGSRRGTTSGSSRSSSRPLRAPARRGNRARSRALEAARRAAWRTALGRQRTRRGQHVRVHAARAAVLAVAGELILLVEDNAKNATLVRDVLQASGYLVFEGDERRARNRASRRVFA